MSGQKHRSLTGLAVAALLLMIGDHCIAAVSVSNLFSNSMVLQRDQMVTVWGKAAGGEAVTVSFNGQKKSTTASSGGTWSVQLDSMNAGGPYTMTIAGTNSITISDVYVGEVWQCAGQSNMDTRVSYYPQYATIRNSYTNPLLRYYTIRQPGGRVTKWETCASSTLIGDLSCMGFFFGKDLQERFDTVAIGLIVTAVGGTTIASWLDPKTVAAHPEIANNDESVGTMYKEWVAPVVGCAMRGTVLIQGEQDRSASLAPYYAERFPMLVNGWREAWGIGEFSFYWVQLANYGTLQTTAASGGGTTAQIREVQRLGLALPNTAMAVAIDIGDSLHFGNKQEAGRRLSLIARGRDYGEDTLVWSGPLFIDHSVDDATIRCRFLHTGGGLTTSDGKAPAGFAIAGADKNWVWGTATIHGDTVSVTSAQVKKPVNVRYAYAGNPVCNLVNKEGLPASPFTTEGEQLPVTVGVRYSSEMPVRLLRAVSQEHRVTVDMAGRVITGGMRGSVPRVTVRRGRKDGRVNFGTSDAGE